MTTITTTTNTTTENAGRRRTGWSERWQGGLCPVGALGGLPIRPATFTSSPPLSQCLILPSPLVDLGLPVDPSDARAAWSAALGTPVVLTESVDCARALLLELSGIRPGDEVALPANATRRLVEAVKSHRARPVFVPLDASLQMGSSDLPAVAEPVGGTDCSDRRVLWVDYADSVPVAVGNAATPALFGLHLSADPDRAGALIALPERFCERARLTVSADSRLALRQLERLGGLIDAQTRAVEMIREGVCEAAGLETGAMPTRAVAHGVLVRIPDESDPATFVAYVRGENTPIRWLPEFRPIHYAAVRGVSQVWRETAEHLSRWLLIPAGPDASPDEIAQAVLGVVKAADYLGVRWRTDPARATAYASAMDARYGPGHDAFRPVFATT